MEGGAQDAEEEGTQGKEEEKQGDKAFAEKLSLAFNSLMQM